MGVREDYVRFQAPYDKTILAFTRFALAADRTIETLGWSGQSRLTKDERTRFEDKARDLEEKLTLAGVEV